MRDRPSFPDRPSATSGEERRINLWRLPRLVSVSTRLVTFPEPRTYYAGSERRETRQAVELRVETSEPIPARAVTPILVVGETAINDYTTEGAKTYRYTAYQPERLVQGAPIRWGWPGAPDRLVATRFRFSLGPHSSGTQA
jgi:hypothetical protein